MSSLATQEKEPPFWERSAKPDIDLRAMEGRFVPHCRHRTGHNAAQLFQCSLRGSWGAATQGCVNVLCRPFASADSLPVAYRHFRKLTCRSNRNGRISLPQCSEVVFVSSEGKKHGRNMKPTACELFALWGGLSSKNCFKSSFISETRVPRTRKTSSLHAELTGDLFSIHVQSCQLIKFPISSQRKRKFARDVLKTRKALNGNNVALIGPHSKAILDRFGGHVKKSYRVPIWAAGSAWLAFFVGMTILHLWFVMASMFRGNLKSVLDACSEYKKLVCKGPCSFSTYYIVNVQ